MKSWKLYIDDIREPTNPDEWVIARCIMDAIDCVEDFETMPNFISFDYDLGCEMGRNETSMEFLDWLIESVMDGTYFIPDDFDYFVHSGNSVGAKNIQCKLDNFLKLYGVKR